MVFYQTSKTVVIKISSGGAYLTTVTSEVNDYTTPTPIEPGVPDNNPPQPNTQMNAQNLLIIILSSLIAGLVLIVLLILCIKSRKAKTTSKVASVYVAPGKRD
jgi:hypothetical protein